MSLKKKKKKAIVHSLQKLANNQSERGNNLVLSIMSIYINVPCPSEIGLTNFGLKNVPIFHQWVQCTMTHNVKIQFVGILPLNLVSFGTKTTLIKLCRFVPATLN
jgi:hypothetical protein